MTKDGRPSRLNDIRLFAGSKHSYLKGFEEQVAFGRRLAWALNAKGVSAGAHTALYIFFTPALPPGTVVVTDHGAMWWQRYVNVGVPSHFPSEGAPEKIEAGIIEALCASVPVQADLVREEAHVVSSAGDRLRFLHKRRETRKYVVEVASTIVAWPAPSLIYVSLTEKATGMYVEAPPAPVLFYADAPRLSGTIKITDLGAALKPRTSIGAQVASQLNGGDLCWAIDEFQPADRPKLIEGLSFR